MPYAKKINRIIKKYKKLFDALEAYDRGKYKRSMIVDTRRKKSTAHPCGTNPGK